MRTQLGAALAAAVLLGSLSEPARAQSKPIDNCSVPSVATAKWTTDSTHHAVKGRWHLHPELKCNHKKFSMSIKAVLRHHHTVQMHSQAKCTSTETTFCRTVAGPRKTRIYGENIRGEWNVYIHFSFSGPDAQTIAASSPKKCVYHSATLTAKCYYIDGPYHIK